MYTVDSQNIQGVLDTTVYSREGDSVKILILLSSFFIQIDPHLLEFRINFWPVLVSRTDNSYIPYVLEMEEVHNRYW